MSAPEATTASAFRPEASAEERNGNSLGTTKLNAMQLKYVKDDRLTKSVRNTCMAIAYFCSGALSINASQFLATPLSYFNPGRYEDFLSQSKGTFGLLTTTATQLWAPTTIYLSGDASVRGQLYLDPRTGDAVCDFPSRLVLVANHQIYTDWLYLWWIAYAAGRHADVHVVLKDALRQLPIIGWGMQLNRFIFLKRKWELDRPVLEAALRRLAGITTDAAKKGPKNGKTAASSTPSSSGRPLANPMWLLLFPEGTNLASSTRARSAAWARRNKIQDTRNVLLPRSTGLHFCLTRLRGSVEWLYDCTIAYAGVPRGAYAHDIFPLPEAYLQNRPPREVSMHWRRFRISDIPLENPVAFERWLQARWREKDRLIDEWYANGGRFPGDAGVEFGLDGSFRRGVGVLKTSVRTSRWRDFLQVLGPMCVFVMLMLLLCAATLPAEVANLLTKQIRDVLVGEDERDVKDVKSLKDNKQAKASPAGMINEKKKPQQISPKSTKSTTNPLPIRGPVRAVESNPKGNPKGNQKEKEKNLLAFDGGEYKSISPPKASSNSNPKKEGMKTGTKTGSERVMNQISGGNSGKISTGIGAGAGTCTGAGTGTGIGDAGGNSAGATVSQKGKEKGKINRNLNLKR